MITSKKVYELVEIFERLPRRFFGHGHLNMWKADIYSERESPDGTCTIEHGCGTIHCHAGWFFIANHLSDIDLDQKTIVRGEFSKKNELCFSEGIKDLYKHFGVVSVAHLCRELRPFTWGNDECGSMFFSDRSFTPRNKSFAETLGDIVDHWAEVAMRLQILELYAKGEK